MTIKITINIPIIFTGSFHKKTAHFLNKSLGDFVTNINIKGIMP